MPLDRPKTTRRGLLAGIAGGGLAGSAGCLTSMPPLGQQVRFGRIDEPSPDPPVYRDWIPADLDADVDRLPGVTFTTPGNLGGDVVGAPFTIGRGILVAQMDYVGVDFETFDYALSVGDVAVARGAVDRSAVEKTLETTSYESAGQYEGLDIYSREDTDRTVAIGDEVVLAGSGEDGRASIERVYDAGQGVRTRLHETDEDFAAISDRVGSSPFCSLHTGSVSPYDQEDRLPESDWGTLEYRFDDEYVYFVTTLLYPPDETASRRDLENAVYENTRSLWSEYVDVRVDGRFGVIVFQQTHERILAESDTPDGYKVPHITWGVEDGGETITLVHEAGDSVDADVLTVEVAREYGEFAEADQQFTDEYATVGPGDRLEVAANDLGDEGTVRIFSSHPDSDSKSMLFSYSRD